MIEGKIPVKMKTIQIYFFHLFLSMMIPRVQLLN